MRPEARGHGVGRRVLAWLAAEAVKRNCGRLEWAVLDWNEPSIQFYRNLGAVHMKEWQIFRLTGPALTQLASVPGDESRLRELKLRGRERCVRIVDTRQLALT